MNMINHQTDYIMDFFDSNAGAWQEMTEHYNEIGEFDDEYRTDREAIEFLADHAEFVVRNHFLNPTMSKYGRAIVISFINAVCWYEVANEIYVALGAGEQWDA